jgi:very-short-patch-repair endonuclease
MSIQVGCRLPRPACGERVGVRGKPRGRRIAALRGKDQKRTERARSLRRASTLAELALWTRIRGRQLGGFKFVRQEPIGRYYVDFLCRDRHLIVELDGGQHSESTQDRQRDTELCALGYRVIRIWNNDVIDNLDGDSSDAPVRTRKMAPHPIPLPASGAREITEPTTREKSGRDADWPLPTSSMDDCRTAAARDPGVRLCRNRPQFTTRTRVFLDPILIKQA